MKRLLSLTFALSVAIPAATSAAEVPAHFDPQGKSPSSFTLELRNGIKAELPFADRRDFEEAKKASSPLRLTRRSCPTPATWPGTWAATSGC